MSTYLYSMSRKKEKEIVRGVTVESVGAEGKAVACIDGKVVFVSNAVPGDVIDVRIDKRREKYMEGTLVGIQTPSPGRLQPFCEHYQDCGGCAWQELPTMQLKYKQQQVVDHFSRIRHLDNFYRIKSRMVALCLNPLQSCIFNILGEYLS